MYKMIEHIIAMALMLPLIGMIVGGAGYVVMKHCIEDLTPFRQYVVLTIFGFVVYTIYGTMSGNT